MNRDVLAQYLKECLLERKQNHVHVSDSPKKLVTRVKTKPLSSQKVGHESKHPGMTWLGHLVMPFGTRKCRSQHVLLHRGE